MEGLKGRDISWRNLIGVLLANGRDVGGTVTARWRWRLMLMMSASIQWWRTARLLHLCRNLTNTLSLTLTNIITITRTLTLSLNLSVAISIYLSLSVSIYCLTVNPQRSRLTCPLHIGTAKWLTGGLAWYNWLISTNDSTNKGSSQRWHQGPMRFFFTWKTKVADFYIKIRNNSFFVIFWWYIFKFDYNKSRDMVQKGRKYIFDFSLTLNNQCYTAMPCVIAHTTWGDRRHYLCFCF